MVSTNQTRISGAMASARDNNFYIAMALACAVTVLVGFAPTYYLKSSFGAPPLSSLLHLHGVIFSSWIALFIVQIVLIRVNRRDWHRRLGVVGAVLAIAMVWVGSAAAINGAVAGTAGAKLGLPPLVFLVIPLAAVVLFVALVACAIYFRHQGETHKRLMMLATISILTPAIARMRLEVFGLSGPIFNFVVTDLFIVAGVIYDYATRRRVHAAYIWGGLAIIVSQPLRLAIGHTDAWLVFAKWLTN